ncbi:MAG TPA: multicopper oxidase family protein [Roseiarcus sp.]|nr:multicopper oxidase family protein [Roseiarcus sp.]
MRDLTISPPARAPHAASRRAVLLGGLAAAAWRLAPARAEAPQPGGFLAFDAAPSHLALLPPPADPTATLAYAGAIPGPLLRLKKGEELKLRFSNRLAEPTTLSFAGLRTANAVAGYGGLTGPRLPPGASVDIRFAPPDAGFNLYLPHAGATDAGQQGRGLFGPIVVDEAEKIDVDDDFVVLLSDFSVDDRGQIRDDFSDPAVIRSGGRKGSLVAANGGAAPFRLKARPGARVRLRLGNAATARLTNVAIDGAKATIVAVDGQPSEPFEPLMNQFPMGPGARFELVFDMPRQASAEVRFALRSEAQAAEAPFVAVGAEGEPASQRTAAIRLPPNPALPAEIALEAARSVDVVVTGGGPAPFAVNGLTFTDWAPKPIAQVPRGAPTVFAFANKTAVVQAMRLGGHVARLLHSMDDGWEPYWRDTILIQPGRTLHVAFVADNPGKWPVESSIPEHRAAGVGAWFEVR